MDIIERIENINGEDYLVRYENGLVAYKNKLSNIDFNPENNRKWLEEHFKVVTITHGVKQNK